MKKYFTVLDVNEKVLPQVDENGKAYGINDPFVKGRLMYLGVAECKWHMNRMNNYWTNYQEEQIIA